MDDYAHDARMEDAYRYHRPILHVYIMDEYGHVIADVDAASTADAMAYYLRSRDIDPDATEGSITCSYPNGKVADDEPIIAEVRTPHSSNRPMPSSRNDPWRRFPQAD